MNAQLSTVLVLLFGVLLGAAGFHFVFLLGMRALGPSRVLHLLARKHPDEYAEHCPECARLWDTRCTCTELVHDFDAEGNVTTGHQPGCPRLDLPD